MADDEPPITGKAAGKFVEATGKLAGAADAIQTAGKKTAKIAEGAEESAARLRSIASRIERTLKVQTTDRGKFYVEEDTGNRSGGQRYRYAQQEGRQRPSYFASREAAEREKQTIASQRAGVIFRAEQDANAAAAERSQQRQTKAAEKGAADRRRFEVRPIVDEQGRPIGGIRGGARGSRPLHEIIDTESGTRATGTGEYTRPENARRRAAELERAEEQSQTGRTKAARKGAAERVKIEQDATKAVSGNLEEFNKRTAGLAEQTAAQRAQHEAYQRRVQAGEAPPVGSPAFEAQAARETEDSKAVEEGRAKPTRTVDTSEEDLQAAREKRNARARQRRADAKLEQARTNEADASAAAAQQKREELQANRRRLGRSLATRLTTGEQPPPAAAAPPPPPIPPSQRPAPPTPPDDDGRSRAQRIADTKVARTSKRDAAAASSATKVDEQAQAVDNARRAAAAASGEEARLATQLNRTAIAADLSSQRFRKHGALTTEFIEAAAKGQVTMRELGYQITATIGKFAGWTAAATAVYAVAGAMAQLGKGAIDSASGVERVHRVVDEVGTPQGRERVQQGFRDLSEQFNVPIADTVDATYGAGKVFNDLDGALKGAAVSLFAMKVGELDAAAATESLAAIVKGFRLEADDLPRVFDAINQVTNRFGGNVGQLVQGVGRAGGQFFSAGGTPEELIGLLGAGSRLTGAPATEVATAIGRSVSVVRTQAGAARARAAGLDPTQDPLSLIRQAQQLAKGASPERVQEIARSIIPSGGQFARIFVPLIENAELLNKVLGETAPEKAKGSAERELAKALREPVEQIAALVNGLQQLGSVLADSGFLAPFGLLVKSLNLAIDGAVRLIGIFNTVVPNPLQPILASALSLYAVTRLLRRLDVGGGATGVRGFLNASPARRERTQVLQGFTATEKFLTNTRERVGQEASVAAFREQQANRRLAAAASSGDDALILRRQQQLLSASEKAADLVEEEADLRTQINDTQSRRVATTRRLKAGESVAEATAARDVPGPNGELVPNAVYRTADYNRPTTLGPEQISPQEAEQAARGQGQLFTPAIGDATRAQGDVDEEAKKHSRALRRFGDSSGKLSLSGRALAGSARGSANAARLATTAIEAAGRGILRAGAGLLAMLGPIDLAIIGVVGLFVAIDKIRDSAAASQARIKKARDARTTGEPAQIRRAAEDLNVGYKRAFVSGGRAGTGFVPTDEIVQGGDEGRTRAENDRIANELEEAQARGRKRTLPQIAHQLEVAKGVAQTASDQREALRAAVKQIKQGFALNELKDPVILESDSDAEVKRKSGIQAANAKRRKQANDAIDAYNAQIAALGALTSDVDKALADVNDYKGLSTIVGQQGALIELHGNRGPVARRARSAIGDASVKAAELYSVDGDPAAYLQALQEQEAAILGPAEDRMERLLEVTRNPAARGRIRRRFLGQVRRGFGLADDQAQNRIDTIDVTNARANQRLDNLQRRRGYIAQSAGVNPLTGNNLGGLPGSSSTALIAKIDAQITALKEKVAQGKAEERAIERGIAYRRRRLREIAREIAKSEFDEQTATLDARADLRAGRTAAGAPRIAQQLLDAGKALARLLASHFASQADIIAAKKRVDELQQQQVEFGLAAIDADTALAVANATTPGGEAAATIEGLQKRLAAQLAHPEVYDANQNKELRAQIIQAQQDEAKRLKEEAEDLIASQFEVRRSRTDNPVRLARLDFREANQRLKRGGFETEAERNRAIADRNNKRREYENAIADRRIENADYAHDIGKLSDEQYLNRLRAIQKTYEKGSEGYRRLKFQIGRFKHDLEDGSELELTPGNVKLPTLTEIRKFIGDRATEKGTAGSEPVATGGHRQRGERDRERDDRQHRRERDRDRKYGTVVNHNRIVLNIAKGEADKVYEILEKAGIAIKTRARSRRPG